MTDWLATLHAQLAAGDGPVVRVVVARVRGSAPREAGASMLVARAGVHGTIGGGHLEHVAIATAARLVGEPPARPHVDRFSLGASLGQCCGGIVELLFVRYDASDLDFIAAALAQRSDDPACVLATAIGAAPRHRLLAAHEAPPVPAFDDGTFHETLALDATPLWLFGAGHVGRALVGMLADLPFDMTWVDSREAIFPVAPPTNGRLVQSPQPADEVGEMPAGAWVLVMTHSHDEDYAICEALLGEGRFGWAGLIGSAPKATRFRQRLARRGFAESAIARIVSPIGIGGIASKAPAAIAVAVAAQLLQLREARAAMPEERTRTA